MSQSEIRAAIISRTTQKLESIGFKDPISTVVAASACLGAREVIAVHGTPSAEIELLYKETGQRAPQTIADIRSGLIIRNLINEKFPTHTIYEEEAGIKQGAEYTWYVDPLDGTAGYSRGHRYATTGVAVENADGVPVSAAIVNSFEKELIVAEKGSGAFKFKLNDLMIPIASQRNHLLEVSDRKDLINSVAYIDAMFNEWNTIPKTRFLNGLSFFSGGNLHVRMSGSNLDQQRQLAVGRAELSLTDTVGGYWDLAAGRLIVEEAGGMFTDVLGKPINKSTKIAIGSNGHLHELALSIAKIPYHDLI